MRIHQGILAPAELGTYTLLVRVTDNTLTGEFETTLEVVEEPSKPPVSPPSPPPAGPVRDVSVYSDNIFFTDENPDLGEPIDVFAFAGYAGSEPAKDVPVIINDIFPVAGELETFLIGRTLVDFPASPAGTMVAVTLAWTNTADGAHIIQVVAEPSFVQNTGNDRATRLISVGSAIDTLTLTKTVVLAMLNEAAEDMLEAAKRLHEADVHGLAGQLEHEAEKVHEEAHEQMHAIAFAVTYP